MRKIKLLFVTIITSILITFFMSLPLPVHANENKEEITNRIYSIQREAQISDKVTNKLINKVNTQDYIPEANLENSTPVQTNICKSDNGEKIINKFADGSANIIEIKEVQPVQTTRGATGVIGQWNKGKNVVKLQVHQALPFWDFGFFVDISKSGTTSITKFYGKWNNVIKSLNARTWYGKYGITRSKQSGATPASASLTASMKTAGSKASTHTLTINAKNKSWYCTAR